MKRNAGLTRALIATLLFMTACSTNWISETEQIVAVLIPATANLVTLAAMVKGSNISAADLNTIQNAGAQAGSDLQLMHSLIIQYQTASTSAQPGLIAQIQATLNAIQVTLNGLLPALHIKDPATASKIAGATGILLSEVQSMVAIMPLVEASASPAMTILAARQVRKQPPLSANEFVKSYNATITARTGDPELDRAAAGLGIHKHGTIGRWASGGLLK